MNIIVENRQEQVKIGDELVTKIEKVAGLCLAGEAPQYDFEVGIILVSNEEIRVLNKEYRNIDNPTDVLSFPLLEARNGRITLGLGDKDPDSGMVQLGDIIISPEKALEQASEFGNGLEEEIVFLVIHGVLHSWVMTMKMIMGRCSKGRICICKRPGKLLIFQRVVIPDG